VANPWDIALKMSATMMENARQALPVSRGIEQVLALASKARPLLGPSTRRLCDSLEFEAERRAGIGVTDLLSQSVGRLFWVEDAKALIERNDQLTKYYLCREALQCKLKEGETRILELRNAEADIKQQPERARDRFIAKYRLSWLMALCPIVNFISSIVLSVEVTRFRGAIGSETPAYADLTARGARCIKGALMASTGALVVALLLAWILLASPKDTFLVGNRDLLAAVLALLATYPLSTVMTAVVLYRWNGQKRRGLRSAS
jgi:hypothetical protein